MDSTGRRDGLFRRTVRHWALMLTCSGLISAALMGAAYFYSSPTYRATAILRADPTRHNPFGAPEPENIDPFLQTQVDLIRSANILSAAGTNPEAARLPRIQEAGDVVLELRKAITVGIRPGTYLIDVSMESKSAREAATLVNAVVEAFNDSSVEWSNGQTRNQIKNLEGYLGELKDQSTDLERRWKELVARGEAGAKLNPPPGLSVGLRERIEDRLVENEIKRLDIAAQLEAVRHRNMNNFPNRIEELETQLEAASILEKTLRARLASIPDNLAPGKMAADDVDIALLKEHHDSLRAMQEPVLRRLEHLKFESRGENRIRIVQPAIAPGAPIKDQRLWLMAIIPFATLAGVFALFAGFEAVAGGALPLAPDPKPAQADLD